MGQMADLNLAAVRQENLALREALRRAEVAIRGMQARERVMELEARFIAAGISSGEAMTSEGAIRSGREVARLYIEALSAEDAQAEVVAAGAGEAPEN